jgi:hypothetical protein
VALEGHAALLGGIDLTDATHKRSVSASLLSGAVVPCGHWHELFGCGVVEAGALGMSLSPSGDLTLQGPSTRPYFAVGARAGVEIKLGTDHLRFRMATDLLGVPVYGQLCFGMCKPQPAWTTLWTMPPVNGALSGGVVGVF